VASEGTGFGNDVLPVMPLMMPWAYVMRAGTLEAWSLRQAMARWMDLVFVLGTMILLWMS
jgi:hypothetical protein